MYIELLQMVTMATRKAQAAMEFLMTYGWALLVVLVAIAALALFGILSPSRFLPDRCDVGTGLMCVDFNAIPTADGDASDITIFLNNGIGQTLRDVRLNATECRDENGAVTGVSTFVGNIAEGRTVRIELNDCYGTAPGSRFRSELVMTYTSTTEGEQIQHMRRGAISVQVQD